LLFLFVVAKEHFFIVIWKKKREQTFYFVTIPKYCVLCSASTKV